jgi:hypothetical protein
MSVKPRLVCPPDYSILALRFTECKKIGVVKGVTTLLSYDLSNFFIPLTNFIEKRFTIKAGATKKLDIGDIAVYWPLQEKYNFVADIAANPNRVANLTAHTFTIYEDEEHTNALATMTFTVDSSVPSLATFALAFQTTYNNTQSMGIVTQEQGPSLSQFAITAVAKGVKYYYKMSYDIANPAGPYVTPGTLTQKSEKYPEGRVRAIFLIADYQRADVSTCTCGCLDASGELLSNVKNFRWAWDSEYTRKQKSSYATKVYVNASAASVSQQVGTTQIFQWTDPANTNIWVSRVPYNLEVGDLITLDETPNNPYAYVTNIDGYNITIDRQGMGVVAGNSYIVKKYAPSSIEWKIGGEMLFISGGQDVYDVDRLYTETIWINNTQNYDIPFTAIIVS